MSRSRAKFIRLLFTRGERQAVAGIEKIFTTHSQLRFFTTDTRVYLLICDNILTNPLKLPCKTLSISLIGAAIVPTNWPRSSCFDGNLARLKTPALSINLF